MNIYVQLLIVLVPSLAALFMKFAMDRLTEHVNSKMDKMMKAVEELAYIKGQAAERKVQDAKEANIKEGVKQVAAAVVEEIKNGART